jgi:phosphatidate cytidylyltransferase
MMSHALLLALGIAGVLAVPSTVAALLKHRIARGQPHDTIDNLITRINAWWVMAALLGTVFWVGALATTLLFAVLAVLALREFIAGVISLKRWIEGALICVLCIAFIPALLYLDIPGYAGRNLYLVVFLLLVTQASDVLQYIWGKLTGRRLIAPAISPSKTVEGFAGGVVSATLLGAAVWWITPFPPVVAALAALGIALLGFAGGLYLSAVKRARGIKDWGNLIKGHGGVLDRLDSLWLPAPVFFIWLKLGYGVS